MNTVLKLDPIISEFETQQEADSYDAWFRAKVEEGLKCEKAYSHDEVVARITAKRARTDVNDAKGEQKCLHKSN